MCNFLWGGDGGERKKIVWVKWEDLCLSKNVGGLDLKNPVWFNYSLISKWIWRFLVDKEALWARVVRARHGDVWWDEDGFWAKENRRLRAGWWNNVLRLSRGEEGRWLRDNLILKLGRGDKILFWHHFWVGEGILKEAFPRLFRLCADQEGTISDMGFWQEGVWVWNVRWRRELLERERDQANALLSFISRVSLRAGIDDEWRWDPRNPGPFSVKAAYSVLRQFSSRTTNLAEDKIMEAIWKVPAPFKVITNAWRILIGRMTTCENLRKRNVEISNEEAICVACKAQEETTEHILFSCEAASDIWNAILKWMGLQAALHQQAKIHFNLFTNLGRKGDRKALTGIWMATVWCIWKWRNECKFKNCRWDRGKICAEIKSRLWNWREVYSLSISHSDFKSWFLAINLLGNR